MQITIKVDLDNDAFHENEAELSEVVLQQIPHNPTSGDSGTLRDSNGNTVGSWKVK